ncbi:MAG: hypothetical protein CL739_01170 [Chloroflexi bacterium]|nr:hypothetical protein [Chloroflexota bacterium]|tara:strand:+ start:144 stop:1289 length:1146 start_codon:yes stop_codon:yes gene_type:complete
MGLIDTIIMAMEELGGKGTLRQIYSEVNQIERTPYPSIRRTIYQHSSECDIYENKYSDIFYAPRGKGKGFWAIRRGAPMKFSYNPGDKLYRKHLHEKYGGSNQGGICPTRSGYIFLFSDPKIGSEFGYRDGWKDDCYMYFGQGQEGDMDFRGNNGALRSHQSDGRRVHLFMGSKGEIIYENQFELDEADPFELSDSLDKNGDERVAIIFRLKPVRLEDSNLPISDLEPKERSSIEILEPENFYTKESSLDYSVQSKSIRKESELVEEYRSYINENNKGDFKRLKITSSGEVGALYTDGWIEEEETLIEAKSSCSRHNIRLGIGQLMDYRYQLTLQGKNVAKEYLLLPTVPRSNLRDLIFHIGIGIIYKKTKGEFVTLDPPA